MKAIMRISTALLCMLLLAAFCVIPAAADGEVENIALLASATASSDDGNPASRTNDGDTGTYWGASTGSDEYLTLTWDTAVEIESLFICWGGGRANADGYDVKISADGVSFETVTASISREEADSTHFNDTVTFESAPIEAKALQIYVRSCAKNSVQMWEIEVYRKTGGSTGPDTRVNLALATNGGLMSSSEISASFEASLANDGVVSSDSRWKSTTVGDSTPAWIAVKLDKAYCLGTLEISWWDKLSPADGKCSVEISDDDVNWIATPFVSSGVTDAVISGQSVDLVTYTLTNLPTAQYVRIYATDSSGRPYGNATLSCFEFEVYEGDPSLSPIKKYSNGTDMFVATPVGADVEGKCFVADYTIVRNGKKTSGTLEIMNAYQKIVLGEEEITPDSFACFNGQEGYVTGIFIDNLKESDKLYVNFHVRNRTFIFLGSSVTYGDNNRSFVEMIDERHDDVDCVKLAVSGTALADINDNSYVSRLLANADKYPVCDHLVVQLSTNDRLAWTVNPDWSVGEVSQSFDKDDFNTVTTVGAIEYIIAYAKEKWNCPVSFYTNTRFDDSTYAEMVTKLLAVSEKWGIGLIDLYNDPDMNAVSDEDYARYMKDSIHPNEVGYEEWWLPKFEEHLFA